MPDIILHHYPQSPVSEKVRVALGIKRLDWHSVEIPRIPPKPKLTPLTGGYRRTPVMQIGADVFCDSQCILRELQQRFPEPTFYPGGADGLPWGINRWTDAMFDQAIRLVLGANADQLPEAFAVDRGQLYLGADWNLKSIQVDLPHLIAQLRGQFGWIEQRLAGGRRFFLGDQSGLPDALVYYLVWFVRGRWQGGPALFAEFPALEAWEKRVQAIGHGTPMAMDADEALDIAMAAEPQTPARDDPADPQSLRPGMKVRVVPDAAGGDPIVTGTIRQIDRETVALLREDPQLGRICVHFPRVGYRVASV